jgi:Zn-finger nucleic acid-binding protein/DNA-directed RNA polymerase subunit RPC12/RpoP
MRLIVACPQCQRQYNATGIQPGRRFRCHCGGEITVRQPKGHSAAVVRCSSCGAPRDKGAAACTHCGADFTIHEQDLHTVCPNCLARVSDRARFCHHCATAISAEFAAGDETPYHCPVCGSDRPLVSRRLTSEQVTVLECEVCAGLWLGLDAFRAMLSQQEVQPGNAPRGILAPISQQSGPRYRACVICSQLMVRRNLGRSGSGVIVDLCGQHGIWFDADELAQLMTWVRSGGREDVLIDLARLAGSDDPVRRRLAMLDERPKPPPPPRPASTEPFGPFESQDAPVDLFGELAYAAILQLSRMFRR